MSLFCLLLPSYFAATTADPSPPASKYPFSTTMLRTHHYSDKPFLSIYEQLSVRMTPDGHRQEAYHIFPGWPFSIRDANDTHILGIRVIPRSTPHSIPPGSTRRVMHRPSTTTTTRSSLLRQT
jgi:hypothetical protein